MRKPCSMCKRNDRRVKQLDDNFYCHDCLDNYRCEKCNRLYDGCDYWHKRLCDCVKSEIEYDYAGHMIFCIQCFEMQDGETQLYKYFKEKYNETLTLVEIQTIIKNNKSKL